MDRPSPVVLVTILWLVSASTVGVAGGVGSVTARPVTGTPCAGTIDRPARGATVVSVQGARGGEKTTAGQIAFGPEGEVIWSNPAGNRGVIWSYDVDPLADGNLFVTATTPGRTLLYELEPGTNRRVWSANLDLLDTHDADLLGDGRVLLANMRNYDEEAGVNRDRLLIYDRDSERVVWEWRFSGRFPPSGGGSYEDDWTHVNDVDRIAPGRYLASVRNFDQVIVVNRTTGAIELRLGRDDEKNVLAEQHNPDYLETERGRPTILVGDSGNNRIVEYTKTDGAWNRTWTLGNGSVFTWPRDADRLPNGNTLVTDSRNHRVLEVTPGGEVVWEVYTPWLPYDAERVRYGDGSRGPTMADVDAPPDPGLHGSAGGHTDAATMERCARAIDAARGGSLQFTVAPTPTPTPTPTPEPGPATVTEVGSDTSTEGESSLRGTGDSGGSAPDGSSGAGGPGPGVLGVLTALALALVVVLVVVRILPGLGK